MRCARDVCPYVAVRVSNQAAIHLYVDTLGYEQNDVEAKYYADGEDAYDMRKTFKRQATDPLTSGPCQFTHDQSLRVSTVSTVSKEPLTTNS